MPLPQTPFSAQHYVLEPTPPPRPGSPSRWFLIGFNLWEVLAGDWKAEERGQGTCPTPPPRLGISSLPSLLGCSPHWGAPPHCSSPPGVATAYFRCSSLGNSSSLVCALHAAHLSVSGLLIHFSSLEPYAVNSVCCRDSDVSTVLVDRAHFPR